MNDIVKTSSLTPSDLELMANQVAASKLFRHSASQIYTLMLLCQADGLHPIMAMRRYHIISFKNREGVEIVSIAMKAEAMLADYQRAGGTVEWTTESDNSSLAEAIFSHPRLCPRGQKVRFSIEDANRADLPSRNPNWVKFPSAQLRARVSSIGVRMVAPALVSGLYTPEEIEDFATTHTRDSSEYANRSNPMESLASAIRQRNLQVSMPVESETSMDADVSNDSYLVWLKGFIDETNSLWHKHLKDHKLGRGTNIILVSETDLVLPGAEEQWCKVREQIQEATRTRAREIWKESKSKIEAEHQSVANGLKELDDQTKEPRQHKTRKSTSETVSSHDIETSGK